MLSPKAHEDATPTVIDSTVGGFSSVRILFSPELIRSTLLIWVVFFGNAFSYYGLVLLSTELSKERDHCVPTESQSHIHSDVNYRDVFITSFAGKVIHLGTDSLLPC